MGKIRDEVNDYEHHYNEGIKYYKNNEYDKANECFTKAIEIKGDYVSAYRYRGRVYSEKKNTIKH